jgi:hypothetical protein
MEELTFSVLQAGFLAGWLKFFLMGFVLTALAPAPGLAAQLLHYSCSAEPQAFDPPQPVSDLDCSSRASAPKAAASRSVI